MASTLTQRRESYGKENLSKTGFGWAMDYAGKVTQPVIKSAMAGGDGGALWEALTHKGGGTMADVRGRQVEDTLLAGGLEAERLRAEEERRGAEGADFLRAEFDRTQGQETLTDEHMRMMIGQGYDEAAGQYRDRMSSVRDALGFTGGGQAIGLARDTELARLGQMDTVRTNAVLEKAKTDALDRMNRWQATGPMYQALTRDVAMQRSDFLNNALGLRYGQEGNIRAEDAAREASQDAKQGAMLSSGAGIAGSLIGLLG